MRVSFRAKYSGRCGACDDRINPGDDVRYDDDQLVHDVCPGPAYTPDQFTLGPLETLCPQCFTIHAGECM